MDIAAIFFTLVILTLVALYLYAPLAKRQARLVTKEEHELSALLAERDRVINSLQELDFDFKLGKIPSEDYPIQRANLLQKGANILRKIDLLTSEPISDTDGEKRRKTKELPRQKEKRHDASHVPVFATENLEDHVEQAIAARRAATRHGELTDERIESLISARRMKRKEKSAGFCPRCGKPVLVSDRFCPSCGKALT